MKRLEATKQTQVLVYVGDPAISGGDKEAYARTFDRSVLEFSGQPVEYHCRALSRSESDEILSEVLTRWPGTEDWHEQHRGQMMFLRAYERGCKKVEYAEKVPSFAERVNIGFMIWSLSTPDPT